MVEVPSGSGRYYVVVAVDDVGRGFLNEHRYALVLPYYGYYPVIIVNGWAAPAWPTPIP
jgi:hypothetical protein